MSTQPEHDDSGSIPSEVDPSNLEDFEKYWTQQYEWLAAAGYRLRSRYSPDWKPSWIGTNLSPFLFEDAQMGWFTSINYAIDQKTNRWVTVKKVNTAPPSQEIEVTKQFSTEPFKSNPENHAVQPIEILPHPTEENTSFIVLPLLRDYDDPPFETVGEIVGFIRQFLQGMTFLHENNVIHGDVSINNIMMDPSGLFPNQYHPIDTEMSADYKVPVSAKFTRTEKAPKYYLIDFGCSKIFKEGETTGERVGTDRTVPEFADQSKPLNGYSIDVYCVGNMLKSEFLDGDPLRKESRPGYKNLEFLRPLVEDMTKDDPSARPTMAEALGRFEAIVKSLSFITLRARCVKKPGADEVEEDEPRIAVVVLAFHHWFKAFTYAARLLPPVPQPKQKKVKSMKQGPSKSGSVNPSGNPPGVEDAGVEDSVEPVPDSRPESAAPNTAAPGSQ